MVRLALLGALVLAAGCGHDDPCGGHSHDPACIVCDGTEDPIPSTIEGDLGNLSIEIVSSDPSPPINANNTMVVRVLDSGGAAIEGATFSLIEPFYVEGGHGTPVIPEVTETSAGEYTVTQVNFLHAGPWELRFDVADGATTDHVVFSLCISE